jgi:hypothetical protein
MMGVVSSGTVHARVYQSQSLGWKVERMDTYTNKMVI